MSLILQNYFFQLSKISLGNILAIIEKEVYHESFAGEGLFS